MFDFIINIIIVIITIIIIIITMIIIIIISLFKLGYNRFKPQVRTPRSDRI